jgi:hypothetical protein
MNWIMREVFDINLEVSRPETQFSADCRIYTHDSPVSVIENVWKVLGTLPNLTPPRYIQCLQPFGLVHKDVHAAQPSGDVHTIPRDRIHAAHSGIRVSLFRRVLVGENLYRHPRNQPVRDSNGCCCHQIL